MNRQSTCTGVPDGCWGLGQALRFQSASGLPPRNACPEALSRPRPPFSWEQLETTMRPKFVYSIDEIAIKQGVPQALAGCPFVLMPWTYPDHINEYLQDLWTGNWHSAYGADNSPLNTDYVFPRKRYRPQPSTTRETANRLVNFLHWCNEPRMHLGRGALNPLAVAERDIDRYGDQMESGLWSSDRKALSASTIGQRQIAVIQFLQWARARGYTAAADFTVSTVRRNVGSASGGRRTTLCGDISLCAVRNREQYASQLKLKCGTRSIRRRTPRSRSACAWCSSAAREPMKCAA